ncbi:MAG: phosphodiesterase [Pseudomonadales bacterium]|nr:phosphodiesterase [Gammaproteobacteria bacterium]NNL57787.1 phosphodiesterase [Pseudomonadales bacterium]
MKKTAIVASLLLLANSATLPLAAAETVRLPLASQGGDRQAQARPVAGMTGKAVVARFGDPISTAPAVGNPPISRWEYPDFYVYFEYNHVVHAVLKHRPAKTR